MSYGPARAWRTSGGEERAIFEARYRLGGVFAVFHAMPFDLVALASDLRRNWVQPDELSDLVRNGSYSQRQSYSNDARRRRTVEPLRTVRRRSGCGGDRGRVAVVDQSERLYIDRVGRDAVFLLE